MVYCRKVSYRVRNATAQTRHTDFVCYCTVLTYVYVYQNPCYCDCVKNTSSATKCMTLHVSMFGLLCVNPTNSSCIEPVYMSCIILWNLRVFSFPHSFYVYFSIRTVNAPIDDLMDVTMHYCYGAKFVYQKTIPDPATSYRRFMCDGISYWMGLDIQWYTCTLA